MLLLLAGLFANAAQADADLVEQSPRGGFEASVSDKPIAPDGTAIQCDLPRSLHMKNRGGSDGAGLCVGTSIEMCASYQNCEQLFGYQNYLTKFPGGGYPQQVDRAVANYCKAQGVKVPEYIQVEERTLRTLALALKTGRPVGSTYCYSPSGRYGGARIAHMVMVAHCCEKWVCVIDNNFPGTYEWMTPAEFLKCSTCGGGNLWAVVLLNPAPPPPPCN